METKTCKACRNERGCPSFGLLPGRSVAQRRQYSLVCWAVSLPTDCVSTFLTPLARSLQASLEGTRDALAEELVRTTQATEELGRQAALLPSMRAELEALRRRHASALELMGERDEEVSAQAKSTGDAGFTCALEAVAFRQDG